jgi:Fic family protein
MGRICSPRNTRDTAVDVERFAKSPIGRLVPIKGHDWYLDTDYSHFAFVPTPAPALLDLSQPTYKAVTDATLALGRLDFAVRRLPDARLLIGPVLRREAQSTSELEGTFAPLDEVLAADFIEASRQSAELREVMNYVAAAERGFELIRDLPICVRMLSELQKILVRGTPGEMGDSGRLRETQVFIGERALGIEQSRFVPVPEGQLLVEGVSEWEKWINERDDDIPLLVKAAVGHYQFETLHPFSDGNGRLGRLVVVLQMMDAGTLAYPVLNLSPWLKLRKDDYKSLLRDVSLTGDFDPWARFFATAVEAQASDHGPADRGTPRRPRGTPAHRARQPQARVRRRDHRRPHRALVANSFEYGGTPRCHLQHRQHSVRQA